MFELERRPEVQMSTSVHYWAKVTIGRDDRRSGMPQTAAAPKLITIAQAASLLASLGGNYALGDELEEIDARTAGLTEDQVRTALE